MGNASGTGCSQQRSRPTRARFAVKTATRCRIWSVSWSRNGFTGSQGRRTASRGGLRRPVHVHQRRFDRNQPLVNVGHVGPQLPKVGAQFAHVVTHVTHFRTHHLDELLRVLRSCERPEECMRQPSRPSATTTPELTRVCSQSTKGTLPHTEPTYERYGRKRTEARPETRPAPPTRTRCRCGPERVTWRCRPIIMQVVPGLVEEAACRRVFKEGAGQSKRRRPARVSRVDSGPSSPGLRQWVSTLMTPA